jgi:hypothetical protein
MAAAGVKGNICNPPLLVAQVLKLVQAQDYDLAPPGRRSLSLPGKSTGGTSS